MEKKYNARILVTGGAGFIGSNFLNLVVPQHPDELYINVDMLTYAADLNNITVADLPNYRFLQVDICDLPKLTEVFETYRPTHIIHFAAESHVDHSILDPLRALQTNILGTKNLADLARTYGVSRFHFISTDEVYGELGEHDTPFTELSPLAPRNPYSASKAGAELLLSSYQHTYGLPLVITRSANNYGFHQDTSKLIPKFISLLLRGEKVPLYATGTNMRNWIFVGDNVAATDLIFRNGALGEIYNIGGAEEFSNIEVTRKLLQLLGKTDDHIEFITDRPGHDFRYALSNEKIESKFGWKPLVSFENGLRDTLEYYRNKFGNIL